MNLLEAVSQMLQILNDGDAIMQDNGNTLPVELFPGLNHPFPGRGEVKHYGFGYFEGTASNGMKYEFCGGGAMQRAESEVDDTRFAFTRLNAKDRSQSDALFEALGVDREGQEIWLTEWQNALISDRQADEMPEVEEDEIDIFIQTADPANTGE